MTIYDKIKFAIQHKHLITAVYDDRVVNLCPYILGKKDGEHYTLCYIINDFSSDDNWRCIQLDNLESVELAEGFWQKARIPEKFHECIDDLEHMIDFRVDI